MNASSPLASASMLPKEIERLLPSDDPLTSTEPIGGSGSNRHYFRLRFASGRELIATLGSVRAENEAFIYLSGKLAEAGINVPRVLAVAHDSMAYLQTSVGHIALFDCLQRKDLIAATMDMMAQVHAVRNIDFSRCYPVPALDRRAVFWDLNYFKYCFLKTTPGLEIDEAGLEDDFEQLADEILAAEPRGFMVRDFQSRNVMIDPQGRPALIDFQGGRLGPVHYDVASFLWQARAGFSTDLRNEMITRYCSAAGLREEEFRRLLPSVVIFRLLQVLGAYGFRGRWERKEHFLRSIPPAIASLRAELAQTPRYPTLQQCICAIRNA